MQLEALLNTLDIRPVLMRSSMFRRGKGEVTAPVQQTVVVWTQPAAQYPAATLTPPHPFLPPVGVGSIRPLYCTVYVLPKPHTFQYVPVNHHHLSSLFMYVHTDTIPVVYGPSLY